MVDNRNDLVGSRPFVDGVKTGHTLAAGYVLVGSATRGPVNVISAVLGDPSEAARDADTAALLELRAVPAARRSAWWPPAARWAQAGATSREPAGGPGSRALGDPRRAPRPSAPSVRLLAPATLEGPLPAGARVGSAVVSVGGRAVARVPVVTAAPVPSVSVLERAVGTPLVVGTLVLATLTLAGAAVLARGRRRRSGARASTRRSRS